MNEINEGPTRICRKCSVATAAAGDFCRSCGSSYAKKSLRPSRKIVVTAVLVMLLCVGATTAVLVKQHNDAVARDEAQETAEDEERSSRADLVDALEEQVTKDAKEKVDDDLLDGPILYSSCTATGGGSTDDLTALTGTFECLAVNKKNTDETVSGYRYSGTAEWDTGSISWRLGG